MLTNKKAESLVGILIGILLLSFVIISLYNLILYSYNTNTNFEENTTRGFLEDNTLNILYKVDTNGINEGTGFYLYKDNTLKTFMTFTGVTNIEYKYIDQYGEKVNTGGTYEGNIYEREITIKKIDPITNNKIYSVSIEKYYRK